MKVEVYQIDTDLDYDGVCFRGYSELIDLQGTYDIDSSIYTKVFSGETGCNSLEDVYSLFNLSPPVDHRGRSMSVSDVVAIVKESGNEYFYCDNIGFKKVEFDASESRESHITVVMCEPDKLARIEVIGTELSDLQKAVGGGFIETYYPFEEEVCIVCNDEGKINGMPLNRSVKREGKVAEIIAGPFFICDSSNPNFGSLSKEQQDKYLNQFKYPEMFFRTGNEIQAIPYKPKQEKER